MQTPSPTYEQLATLHDISRRLNSTLDLEGVLNYVMDRVVAVTGAERGFLMLYDADTDALNFQIARGMHQEDLGRPEFEVSHTIIQEVLSSQSALLTLNAQFDERVGDSESVITKGLRSILCVPIMRRERIIGLVYLDNRLRVGTFDESHRYLVSAFASEAGFAIENARLYQIAIEQGRIQRELEMARNIQQGLLPNTFTPLEGYEVSFAWQAAHEVAGDFYDCLHLSDNQMGLLVADVSDKGTAAALFMAVARSLFRNNARAFAQPMEAVQHTNAILYEDASAGMFVTLYYGVFSADGLVRCINAGHNLPLIFRAEEGQVQAMPRGGQPLGWFPQIPLREDTLQLAVGDVFLMYTDGLTEAENNAGEAFGEEQLAAVLKDSSHHNAHSIKQHILKAVADFTADTPRHDDITLIVVRYLGA